MFDHYIDDSVEAVLPSTDISMATIDARFRIHNLLAHRESRARAMAAPVEVQQEAVKLVREKAYHFLFNTFQSYTNLTQHTHGAALRYARELIGGREDLREWKESRSFLAAFVMYAHNLMQTTGCDLPELVPPYKFTQAQIGKRMSQWMRDLTTTLSPEQRAAAIEIALVGYDAYRIQLEQGVPGATASKMAWAAHGPLRTFVPPPPPPVFYEAAPDEPVIGLYFFPRTEGQEIQKLGSFPDYHGAKQAICARMWSRAADQAMAGGDYTFVDNRNGALLSTWHVSDDLTLTFGDDAEPVPASIIEGWLHGTGIPTPPGLIKPRVPLNESRAAKSNNMKVLATPDPLLIRTDFSDDVRWAQVRDAATEEKMTDEGYPAKVNVVPVDDRQFEGLTTAELLGLPWPDPEGRTGRHTSSPLTLRRSPTPNIRSWP